MKSPIPKTLALMLGAGVLAACGGASDPAEGVARAEPGPAVSAITDRPATPAALPAPPEPAEPVAGLLASAEKLKADTVVAARYGDGDAGSSLLGVWAESEPGCSGVDQDDGINFAVVTPSSIRDADARCAVALVADNAVAELSATCMGGGSSEERQIRLESAGPDHLLYQPQPDDEAVDLVRCRLPR